jgi:hypothetical protein
MMKIGAFTRQDGANRQAANAKAGTGNDSGAAGGSEQSSQHTSQQENMPPSQTDDNQYDQGTVKRAP